MPSVGMEFDSVDETWQFWVEYGKKTGFGVRKQYFNKRKEDGSIRSCRFNQKSFLVQNPKAETRTECNARIALKTKNEKFVIHEFIEVHTHPLQLAETIHMLASHRKISEVQAYGFSQTTENQFSFTKLLMENEDQSRDADLSLI